MSLIPIKLHVSLATMKIFKKGDGTDQYFAGSSKQCPNIMKTECYRYFIVELWSSEKFSEQHHMTVLYEGELTF